jgi:hypothetical protein
MCWRGSGMYGTYLSNAASKGETGTTVQCRPETCSWLLEGADNGEERVEATRRFSREDPFSRTSWRAMITRGGGGRWWCLYGGDES